MHTRKQLPYKKTFTFLGKQISYEVVGKGKKLILVHGAFNHDVFRQITPQLSKLYQLYILHLPGFGASDGIDNRRHDTNLFAEALDGFVNDLKLEKEAILALSLGCVVTVKAAMKGNIKGKLILVGMPGEVHGLIPRIVGYIPVSIMRSIVATEFGKKKILVPAMRQNISSGSEDSIIALLSHTDIRSVIDIDYYKEIGKDIAKVFPKIKNKMYFLYGEHDPLRNTTRHLFKKFTVIKDSDHGIFSNSKDVIKEIKKIV